MDVQQHFMTSGGKPRREVWVSLGTPSQSEARKRVAGIRSRQHLEWGRLRTRRSSSSAVAVVHAGSPSAEDVRDQAVRWAHHRLLDRHDRQRQSLSSDDEEGWRRLGARHDKQFAQCSRRIAIGDFTPWHAVAARIAANAGWNFTPGSQALLDLSEHLAHATRDTLLVSCGRVRGDFSGVPLSSTVRGAVDREADTAASGEDLMSLFEKYEKQCIRENRKSLGTLSQQRLTINAMAAFVGVRRAVKSLKKGDIREFREALLVVPIKWTARTDYAGLSLREAAKKAAVDDLPPRDARTVAREISAVSTLFRWMIGEGYADDNPALGLAPHVENGSNAYPPFSIEQLNSVFGGPLFLGHDGDGREHMPGPNVVRDWRFWLPLIGLFTGARLNEIVQLLCDDVAKKFDIWYFDIDESSDEGTAKKLKRDASRRVVPLHSKLLALGLLDYVETVKASGETRLFPSLWVTSPTDPSKFWRKYLRGIGVKKTSSDGIGFHSFRHTFVDECREAGTLDAIAGSLVGHAKVGMTSKYGEKTEGNLTQRKAAIEAMPFAGLNLAPLSLLTKETSLA